MQLARPIPYQFTPVLSPRNNGLFYYGIGLATRAHVRMWALVYLVAARRLVAAAAPGARYKLLQKEVNEVLYKCEAFRHNAVHG